MIYLTGKMTEKAYIFLVDISSIYSGAWVWVIPSSLKSSHSLHLCNLAPIYGSLVYGQWMTAGCWQWDRQQHKAHPPQEPHQSRTWSLFSKMAVVYHWLTFFFVCCVLFLTFTNSKGDAQLHMCHSRTQLRTAPVQLSEVWSKGPSGTVLVSAAWVSLCFQWSVCLDDSDPLRQVVDSRM